MAITKWTRRRDKLIEHLCKLDADICCLQEVSAKALKETFIPGLQRIGLECCGFAPSRVEKEAKGKFGHKNIGCATFYRPLKLQLLSSKRIHLRDFVNLQNCRSHEFYVDVDSKWNSMVMSMFAINATQQSFVVGNAHLFWDPQREDVKTMQAFAAVQALSKFMSNDTKQITTPTVLCGDFNILPYVLGMEQMHNARSGAFELFENGHLSNSHIHHPDTWFNAMVNKDSPNPRIGELKSVLRFSNAYELPDFHQFRPLFTTKTDDFQGWIDHIWINAGIDVEMVLGTPIAAGDLYANRMSRAFPPIPNKVHSIVGRSNFRYLMQHYSL